MKWFILVVMMGTYSDGSKDTYLFYKPELPSLKVCQEYVYQESDDIKRRMMIEFDGKSIDKVFCISEKKLKQFFNTSQKESGTRT